MRRAELPALTGIRFYAALFVFLSHVTILPGMEAVAGQRLFFNAGVVGVSFFFVLSGFILTYNYADVFRTAVSVDEYGRFVWDRFTKIYPVHVATLLLVLPIAVLSPNLPLDWRALPFHVLMLQCFWPLSDPTFYQFLNVPSWSISCEWFFYLLAPTTMFLALGNWRRQLLIVGLASAYVAGLGWFLWHVQSDFSRLYLVSWFAPSRFVEFLVGVFLGRAFLNGTRTSLAAGSGLVQGAGIILIVAGAMYRQYAPWPMWGGLLYVPGSALLVFGLALGRSWFAAHLGGPWLHKLGTTSFSLYMVHAPILRAMKGVWLHFGWEVHSRAAFAGVIAGMFVVVQIIAFMMCYGYEIPLQTRLRRLLRATTSQRGLTPLERGIANV